MISVLRFAAFLAAFTVCTTALAAYPQGPVKLIVPLSAGGATHSAEPILAQSLARARGQPVLVENKPGADGSIAALSVIGAKPDGQTLFFSSTTAICAIPTMRRNPPYDPLKAFTPVSMVGTLDLVLFAHPSVEGRSLGEVLKYVKANPGKIN